MWKVAPWSGSERTPKESQRALPAGYLLARLEQPTGFRPIQRLQICAGQLHLVQNSGGVGQQVPARLRQLRPAAASIEEAAAQLILQRLDGVTHGRLGEEKLTGGIRKTATTRKGREGEQLAAVE